MTCLINSFRGRGEGRIAIEKRKREREAGQGVDSGQSAFVWQAENNEMNTTKTGWKSEG